MSIPDSDAELRRSHSAVRSALRFFGPLIVAIGLVFLVIGLIDFFTSFGGFGPPKRFWTVFVGIPMIGVGGGMCQYGYMRAVARYQAREMAPVVSEAANEIAEGVEPSVRRVTRAVSEELNRGGAALVCPSCSTSNAADARFCDSCGESLQQVCGECGRANDGAARFCDSCGRRFGE